MHLVYVARQLEVVVVSGEGGAGQAEKMTIRNKKRRSHTIGSLQRTISSSLR